MHFITLWPQLILISNIAPTLFCQRISTLSAGSYRSLSPDQDPLKSPIRRIPIDCCPLIPGLRLSTTLITLKSVLTQIITSSSAKIVF